MDIYQCTMFDDVIMIIEKLAIVVNPKNQQSFAKTTYLQKLKGNSKLNLIKEIWNELDRKYKEV